MTLPCLHKRCRKFSEVFEASKKHNFWKLHFCCPPRGSRKVPIKQGLSVLSTVFLSFLFLFSGRFVGILSLFFSKSWHGETNMKLCVTEGFSWKGIFAPKFGTLTKYGPKTDFEFYWICSVMKICIICCVPAQIPYLGKIFPRYRSNCSQPIRLQDD